MSQSPRPRGLGRGLSALLGDEDVAATVVPRAADTAGRDAASVAAPGRAPFTLPIGHLRPGKMQPRTTFEDLEALVDSVKEYKDRLSAMASAACATATFLQSFLQFRFACS